MQKSGNFDKETDLEKDIVEKSLGRIKCNYYEAANKKEYQSKIDINKTKDEQMQTIGRSIYLNLNKQQHSITIIEKKLGLHSG